MVDIILDNPSILLSIFSVAFAIFAFSTIDNLFLKGILGLTIIGSILSIYTGVKYPNKPEYKNDEVYTAKMISGCKLLEENHYNGIFSENTNKLDCGGVIKNVPMSDYDKAIHHSTDNEIGNADRD